MPDHATEKFDGLGNKSIKRKVVCIEIDDSYGNRQSRIQNGFSAFWKELTVRRIANLLRHQIGLEGPIELSNQDRYEPLPDRVEIQMNRADVHNEIELEFQCPQQTPINWSPKSWKLITSCPASEQAQDLDSANQDWSWPVAPKQTVFAHRIEDSALPWIRSRILLAAVASLLLLACVGKIVWDDSNLAHQGPDCLHRESFVNYELGFQFELPSHKSVQLFNDQYNELSLVELSLGNSAYFPTLAEMQVQATQRQDQQSTGNSPKAFQLTAYRNVLARLKLPRFLNPSDGLGRVSKWPSAFIEKWDDASEQTATWETVPSAKYGLAATLLNSISKGLSEIELHAIPSGGSLLTHPRASNEVRIASLSQGGSPQSSRLATKISDPLLGHDIARQTLAHAIGESPSASDHSQGRITSSQLLIELQDLPVVGGSTSHQDNDVTSSHEVAVAMESFVCGRHFVAYAIRAN